MGILAHVYRTTDAKIRLLIIIHQSCLIDSNALKARQIA